MSYVVLARKWRPQTFADLVGQEHVSRTLANAIATDRVAHAFLFTGVRGVGKTTSARILAKTLNCAEGPTATPCLRCHACLEIADGKDIDVQEIDGASYTGVDAVRQLQESIPYRPARDRFKIFIVDEVHMLSTAAWNAFLKTLEEPPPHVKFIFATTEVQKVPVTILSRCQRYDFKLISSEDIAARLRQVLDTEKIGAADEALRIIAREAAGSMRDAMSLLDQVIAWAGQGQALNGDDVARVLGVAARSVLHQLGSALVDGDAGRCLDVVAELAAQGYSLQTVARDFLAHLRDLVVARVHGDPARLMELSDGELADLTALAKRVDPDELSRLYLGFSRSFDDIARSAQPRAALEMALVRLARRPPLVPLDELLRRLAELERTLAGSAPSGTGGAAAPRGGASPRGSAPRGAVEAAPPEARPFEARPTEARPTEARPPEVPGAEPEPEVPRAAHASDWDAILALLRARKAPVASVYEHAAPLAIGPGRLQLAFEPGSFLSGQAADAKALVAEVASAHFGVPTAVELDETGRHTEAETVAARNSAELSARRAEARRRVEEHPLVRAAVDVLGAQLREVRLPGEAS